MNKKKVVKKPKNPFPKDRKFSVYWKRLAPNIETRENFSEMHLKNLEILCRLYVEYDALTCVIQEEGFTYISFGRNGEQIKPRPEVTMREKIYAEIRQYSRLLGIVLAKDNTHNENESDGDWQ